MNDRDTSSLLLPERARLFHIGLPKTGTTSIQAAAHEHRSELLKSGVYYPGKGVNHLRPVYALMGRSWGWKRQGGGVPPMKHWNDLMREIRSHRKDRIWISQESASWADDEAAQRFADQLGNRLHVVVTLRDFPSVLRSVWQQSKKTGTKHTFDGWLQEVLADPPNKKVTPAFHRCQDQSGVIERWASIVGAENVTAIVVNTSQKTLIADTFEQMLGLPEGLLSTSGQTLRSNRTMSLPEAELFRMLNEELAGKNIDWQDYRQLVYNGAIARLLDQRQPGADEPRITLPNWAIEPANERATFHADRISRSGVRIVGDLTKLYPADNAGEVATEEEVTTVPIEVAVQALAGMLSASTSRGPFFKKQNKS